MFSPENRILVRADTVDTFKTLQNLTSKEDKGRMPPSFTITLAEFPRSKNQLLDVKVGKESILRAELICDDGGNVTGIGKDGLHTWHTDDLDNTYDILYRPFGIPEVTDISVRVSVANISSDYTVIPQNKKLSAGEVAALELETHGYPLFMNHQSTIIMYLTGITPEGSPLTAEYIRAHPLVPALDSE